MKKRNLNMITHCRSLPGGEKKEREPGEQREEEGHSQIGITLDQPETEHETIKGSSLDEGYVVRHFRHSPQQFEMKEKIQSK
jgi:hypothetical protein